MRRNKGIVLVSTTVVVLLGLFLGLKFINKPKNEVGTNVKNTEVAKANEEKEEKKDNFLSQSLREEKERKEKEEKDTIKDDTKEEKDTKETSSEKDKENKDSKETNSEKEDEKKEESKTTSGNKVEVYDDKYVVKKGDTLFSIAKEYFENESINEAMQLIQKINKMENAGVLREGDKLLIPTEDNIKNEKDDKTKEKEEDKKTNSNTKEDKKEDKKETSQSKGNTYTVKKGDTLIDIANNHMKWCKGDEAVKLLMKNNNLKSATDLKADQKIYIPTEK
ncbi:LysM peptidoglycan-binding domain-containing protein [Hathewaya histolytica]|uniref:LysM domain-containing protein n=1 Tax=Hathewaya histolytica TaxID=1498 RepID=A0A4U9QVA1_HATHI|nr:LysM peptidoglycan-binding domain-containing protein [Hathewaya histolytica]VTQ82535.1 LysM domain-containing protein [Hathewaya histolytica]